MKGESPILFYIVFGFIIPWIIGVNLFKKNQKVVLTIAPFDSVISLVFNEIGLFLDFWDILPNKTESLNCLPIDLGIYPIFGSLFIHYCQKNLLPHWILLLSFSLFTSGLEYITVLTGSIVYHNGWNIFWTFISYVLAYILGYSYYVLLKRNLILR
ncbi:CBO0543 family protein [Brevibacillus centrosporus]|jgi:hypothetical protein|uniref:CBO0543 family protein n=1 Tax=Brevibacillus centrosporus TaxID=54910 RepID=UPI003986F2EA